MKPGRELDRLVAVALGDNLEHPGFYWMEQTLEDGDGWDGWLCPRCWCSEDEKDNPCVKRYSTDIKAAMEAWDWLEKNNPWKQRKTEYLILFRWEGKPTVGRIFNTFATNGWTLHKHPLISGDTYPHAICLAILEATK